MNLIVRSGAGNCPLSISRRSARHFEDRGAPRSVVVRARLVVIHVRGDHDFLAGVLHSRDDASDDVERPRLDLRVHDGVETNGAPPQESSKLLRTTGGHQKRETPRLGARRRGNAGQAHLLGVIPRQAVEEIELRDRPG